MDPNVPIAAPSVKDLLDFPTEILSEISSHVPHSTQKALRLTNHRLSAINEPFVFHTIGVGSDEGCLQRLLGLCENPGIRRGIKCVRYTFDSYCCHIRKQLPCDPTQLWEGIFAVLPQKISIELVSQTNHEESCLKHYQETEKGSVDAAIAESYDIEQKELAIETLCLVLERLSKKIHTLTIKDIRFTSFRHGSDEARPTLYRGLANVEHLSIRGHVNAEYDDRYHSSPDDQVRGVLGLRRFFMAAKNAQSVKITFPRRVPGSGFSMTVFEPPFAQQTVWPKLKELSLSCLEVEASHLIRLLKVHEKTLEVVRLGNIGLEREREHGDPPTDYEDPGEDNQNIDDEGVPASSWDPVFAALRALPKLKNVDFWGNLKDQGKRPKSSAKVEYPPKQWQFSPLEEGGKHIGHENCVQKRLKEDILGHKKKDDIGDATNLFVSLKVAEEVDTSVCCYASEDFYNEIEDVDKDWGFPPSRN